MSKEEIGKRVIDDLYLHLSALGQMPDRSHREMIEAAVRRLPPSASAINVAKLNLRTGRISLLEYRDFETAPYPTLAASWSFEAGPTVTPTYRTYESSLNPPILHRKELLVSSTHPERQRWAETTAIATNLGLFDDTRTIGFRLNWERLVESKGYRIVDGEFQPMGNDLQTEEDSAVDWL